MSTTLVPTPEPIAAHPRLLRIRDAARYLSCTYGWVETLVREKSVPSLILGKRRLIDIRDLDSYVESVKREQSASPTKLLKAENQRAA
jgi:excisionase family DNA binding protein